MGGTQGPGERGGPDHPGAVGGRTFTFHPLGGNAAGSLFTFLLGCIQISEATEKVILAVYKRRMSRMSAAEAGMAVMEKGTTYWQDLQLH